MQFFQAPFLPHRTAAILAAILIHLFTGSLNAQTCSCAGAPLTNSLGIGSINTHSWQIQLSYDAHRIQHLLSRKSVLEVGVNQRHTQTALLQVSHALGERWQLSAVFSWVEQRFQAPNTVRAQGFGDMILLGQYRIIGSKGSLKALYLGAGAKLPTGKTGITNEGGLLLTPDLQAGTGAWDGIFSLLYTQSGLWSPASSLQLSATYRITSEAQRFNGTQSYRFGPEILLQAGLSQAFAVKQQQLTPSLLVRYKRNQPDLLNGISAFNTGGSWLNAGGGLQWSLNEWASLQTTVLLPLYRKVEGVQLTSSWRLNIGVNIGLPIASGNKSSPELPSLGAAFPPK